MVMFPVAVMDPATETFDVVFTRPTETPKTSVMGFGLTRASALEVATKFAASIVAPEPMSMVAMEVELETATIKDSPLITSMTCCMLESEDEPKSIPERAESRCERAADERWVIAVAPMVTSPPLIVALPMVIVLSL